MGDEGTPRALEYLSLPNASTSASCMDSSPDCDGGGPANIVCCGLTGRGARVAGMGTGRVCACCGGGRGGLLGVDGDEWAPRGPGRRSGSGSSDSRIEDVLAGGESVIAAVESL